MDSVAAGAAGRSGDLFPPQVGPLHVRVGEQVGRRPLDDDLADLEYVAAIGHPQGGAGVLLDEQDGVALVAEPADD